MGVRQRDLLETTTHKDTSSLVLWTQTQYYHIELLIPKNLQTGLRNVNPLQEYNDDELQLLATQQGFAGITQIAQASMHSSDICQWLCEIDYQPATNQRDIGKILRYFPEFERVIAASDFS